MLARVNSSRPKHTNVWNYLKLAVRRLYLNSLNSPNKEMRMGLLRAVTPEFEGSLYKIGEAYLYPQKQGGF